MSLITTQPRIQVPVRSENGANGYLALNVKRSVQPLAAMSAVASLPLAAMSDCAILGVIYTYEAIEPEAADARGKNEISATFVFETSTTEFATVTLPGIRSEFLASDRTLINTENPQVLLFINHIINNFCDPFGVPFTQCVAALVTE